MEILKNHNNQTTETKPIFVITLPIRIGQQQEHDVREKLNGYHVIFLTGESEKCQLFSIKETIEMADLKQLQDYLGTKKQ